MNIKEKLLKIQQELKAPKGQYNSFGKYKYRSCEDILEALKPLLKDTKTILTINDEMQYIGERYYIKATAILSDTESIETISNSAYAREEETKKGMDGSQITGASSSYARKYALNGLFGIDDTKDSDTTNTGDNKTAKKTKQEENYRQQLVDYCKKNNIDMNEIAKTYGISGRSTQDDFYDVCCEVGVFGKEEK